MRKSFAEIVAEVQAAPGSGADDLTDRTNTLRDPNGTVLERTLPDATPQLAARLVREGALLAFEGCGCGGWAGCPLVWIDEAGRSRAAQATPRFGRHARRGWPSWIEVWEGSTATLVYVHGDVVWADVCS